MNICKNIDYTDMYEALDVLMARQLPQMELYCEIGKAVYRRTEKGAAVMASEYLNQHYPDVKGFSPRSLLRMRDFYRTYENHPSLLSRAMKLGWTHNVVIMETDLSMDLREWYMKAAEQFGRNKSELIENIICNVYQHIICDTEYIASAAARVENIQTELVIPIVALPRIISHQIIKFSILWKFTIRCKIWVQNNSQWEMFVKISLMFMRC